MSTGRKLAAGAMVAASMLSIYSPRVQRAYASGSVCGQVTDSNSLDAAIYNFNDPYNSCNTLVIAQSFTLSRAPLALASSTKDLYVEGGGHAIDGDNSYRVLAVTLAAGKSMTVSDLTIRDGVAPAGNPSTGGAVTFSGGHLYVDRCVFEGNTANRGGAINTTARLTIDESVFTDNEAHIDNGNEGRGGAVWTTGPSLAITNSSFVSNGALDPSRQLNSGSGGAIHALNTDISIVGTTLADNESLWMGGAIRVDSGDLELVNSTVTGNTSRWGGAVYAQMRQAHAMSIDFSTITGNSASQVGGAIFAYSKPAMVVPISNSIINGNLVGQSASDAYGNPFQSSYCYSNPCPTEGPTKFAISFSAYTSPGSINQVDSVTGRVLSATPLVESIGDNGGFLLPDGSRITTMNPLEGSAALGAANPVTTGFPTDDQRGQGFPRIPASGPADIGAIQRTALLAPPGNTPPPPLPATAPIAVVASAGDASASVSWSVPASAGSYPVTNYQVTSTPGGRMCLTSGLSCEITGLVNGTAYTFTVKALTGAGWSPASDPSNAVTPVAASRPTITITGTREGKRISVTGSTTGLGMGGLVTPWTSRASADWVPGREVAVSVDGGFAWSRRAGAGPWRIYFTAEDARSNTVTIR